MSPPPPPPPKDSTILTGLQPVFTITAKIDTSVALQRKRKTTTKYIIKNFN